MIHRLPICQSRGLLPAYCQVSHARNSHCSSVLTSFLYGAAQVYKDLDIPESKRDSLPHSSPHRAETNGTSRAGSGHLDSPANGKAEIDPVVLGCHLVDFWTNICLCQSLIVEEAEDDGLPIYQASPALTV